MSFFAVLLALVIEQVKPLARDNWVHHSLLSWTAWAGSNLDAGRRAHAAIVWCVSVLAPALLAAGVHVGLLQVSFLLALLFDVGVLYLTLGFRQFSHHFTDVRDALEQGDEAQARRLLAAWCHLDASELPREALLRHLIEHALLAAHRHVFGVFFWFVVLYAVGLGPAGAVLYRLAEFVGRYWAAQQRKSAAQATPAVVELSARWFQRIDHVPARMTAFGFAIVGNFEEAINAWRQGASQWKHANEGVVLAAAAGALGVQLGGPAPAGATPERAAASGPADGDDNAVHSGATPQQSHLLGVVGLVWRSVVLWLLLLALLTLANVLG